MTKGSMKIYKSYNFVDKDPVIDRLRTMIADERVTYRHVAEESGVSEGTLSQWFAGKTMRPQFATVMAVARALGYDLQVVKQERRSATVVQLLDAARRRRKAA